MTVEAEYRNLKEKLNEETRFHSNPNMWLRNRHYKAIVILGQPVIPLILGDLARHLESGNNDDYPGWWAMYALPDLTGVRIPVGGPEVEMEGGFAKVSVDDVSKFWVDWGKAQKLL